jgi:hypothetical protein
MANPVETSAASPLSAAAFGDPSKLNFFNANEQDQQEYQNALKQSLTALEERYARPNWFKIAAGFAKPQLGGFMAGLGSAAEAMGENVEQQRAAQLPISQLRAQLAMSKIGMGQSKDAAQAFTDWKKSGKPMDENVYSQIAGLAPNSAVAAAAKAAFDAEKTNQSLRVSQNDLLVKQQQQDFALLDAQRKAGMIDENQYKAGLKAIAARQVERPPVFPMGTTGNASDRLNSTPAVDASANPPISKSVDQIVAGQDGTKPPTEEPKKGEFKFKPSFALKYKQAATEDEKAENAKILALAEKSNAVPQAQFEALQKVVDPQHYPIAMSANLSIKDAIKSDPKTFIKVTDLLRSAGSAVTMAEKGISFNWNGYGVNVGIPMTAGLDAGLDANQRAYRDTLINNLATSAYYGLLARGIDPSKAGEGKLGQLLLQEMNIDKNPKTIDHQTDLNMEQLKHATRLHNIVSKRLPEVSGYLAPHLDIFRQDPEMEVEKRVYEQILKDRNSKYYTRLKGKAP